MVQIGKIASASSQMLLQFTLNFNSNPIMKEIPIKIGHFYRPAIIHLVFHMVICQTYTSCNMGANLCMRKPSPKFLILFLNINQRFLILDVQKLERMFKITTYGKLILVLLALILVAQGQFIKHEIANGHKTSKMVTVTTGEPVLRTQTIQTKQTIVRGNGHHHDHSDIVFDGPEEEIVMRINLQFDKELKHFRIQQLNYENEDFEDEVVIQDVTQTKKISQNVNHISNVVTTTKTVNQNVQESNVISDASVKPFVSKLLLKVEPKIAVESQEEGKTYISSNKAEEQPIITATAVKADDEENPNNKWMRLFNVNHDKAEKESKQKNSEGKVRQASAELPIVTKAKELLAKKASLSRHQDEESSQEKESETQAESASTNTQGSTPNSESGSTPTEQTPTTNPEGTTTPAEQTPPANTEGGSVPVQQTPNTEETSAPTQQAPAEQAPIPIEQTPAVPTEQTPVAPSEQTQAAPTEQNSPTLNEQTNTVPSEQTSPALTEQTSAAPVEQSVEQPVEQPAPVNTEEGSTSVEVPTNVEGSPAPVEQIPPASTESGSLQAEQAPPANNGEGSSAPVEQSPPATNQSESESAPPAEVPQEQAQSEEAGFLSLFN